LGNRHVQPVEQPLAQKLNGIRLPVEGFPGSARQSARRELFAVDRDSSPQKSGCGWLAGPFLEDYSTMSM